MLGVLATLSCNEVWADIEREACCTSIATRELRVHIDGFILTTRLHCALTIGIIPIVAYKTVLIGCKESVLLVPLIFLLGCLFIFLAVFLYTRGVDIDKIAVGIISVLVSVVDIRTLRRSLFRAVVDVTNIVELELLACILAVSIGQVVACMECTLKLYARLREVLM